MDFCPNCGSMLLNGPICGNCNYNSKKLSFERLEIGTPNKYISISKDNPKYAEILLKLIINKNNFDIDTNDILKFGDKIIESANRNFIKNEKRFILTDFNEFLESQDDLIDKSKVKSRYYREYFNYYADLKMDRKIDEFNINISKQKFFDDFEGKYVSYSEMCEYMAEKNLSYPIDSIVEEHNRHVIKKQMDVYQHYFDDIVGKSLDDNQRIAVLTDDDNTQIVAGAGTGKTLTIQAKVKFLLEKQNINSNFSNDDYLQAYKISRYILAIFAYVLMFLYYSICRSDLHLYPYWRLLSFSFISFENFRMKNSKKRRRRAGPSRTWPIPMR